MMPEELGARAPYNFVPLPERRLDALPPPSADRYGTGLVTGSIEYTVTTETPLFIGSSSNTRGDDPPEVAEFFAPAGRPVIPGASLRGMISTLVEIMSWSQPRVMDDRLLFYRAIPQRDDPLGNAYVERLRGASAGWISRRSDGHYVLREAREVAGQRFFRIRKHAIEAQLHPPPAPWSRTLVWFDPNSAVTDDQNRTDVTIEGVSSIDPGGWEPGVLIQPASPRGESTWTPLDHGWIVPLPDVDGRAWPLDERVVREYLGMRGEDRGGVTRAVRDHHFAVIPDPDRRGDLWMEVEGVPAGDASIDLRGWLPAFFIEHDNTLYFGHTRYFRVPYKRRLAEGLPPELAQTVGRPPDLAQSLFGYISDDASVPAQRSRVMFEDAELLGDPTWDTDSPEQPSALFAPRPTSFQHYLEQPVDGDPPPRTRSWDDVDGTPGQRTRGWKLYWHRYQGPARAPEVRWQRDADPGREEATGKSARRSKIRPLKRGNKFTSRIRFENLEKHELGALVAAIELPGGLRHHIGFAKPLGMGTVHVEVTRVMAEDRSRTDRYRRFSVDGAAHVTELEGLDAREHARMVHELRQPFFDWVWRGLRDLGEVTHDNANLWSSVYSRMQALRNLLQYDLDSRIAGREPWAIDARWTQTRYMTPAEHLRNVRLPPAEDYAEAYFMPPT